MGSIFRFGVEHFPLFLLVIKVKIVFTSDAVNMHEKARRKCFASTDMYSK